MSVNMLGRSMKQRTEVLSARAYPGTAERLRSMRDQLAALYPDRIVTMADVLDLAVGSASAALANGTLHGLPQPTGTKRDDPR